MVFLVIRNPTSFQDRIDEPFVLHNCSEGLLVCACCNRRVSVNMLINPKGNSRRINEGAFGCATISKAFSILESMHFVVPKTTNYNPDEGNHIGTLVQINENPATGGCYCSCDGKVRLTFHLESDNRIYQFVAASTFCTEEHGEDLLEFLQSWLGEEWIKFLDADGKIDLDSLIGRKGVLLIAHVASKKAKHTKPFCKIVKIRPYNPEQQQEAA